MTESNEVPRGSKVWKFASDFTLIVSMTPMAVMIVFWWKTRTRTCQWAAPSSEMCSSFARHCRQDLALCPRQRRHKLVLSPECQCKTHISRQLSKWVGPQVVGIGMTVRGDGQPGITSHWQFGACRALRVQTRNLIIRISDLTG